MQYTPHYNLNLPEGTDIVNPLVQDNPNYSAIDTALYDNKLRVIGTATHVKTGTNHAITLGDSDINQFKFVATGDYATGDTFTVDGVTVTPRIADGSTIPNGAFKINSTVLCSLDGTVLNLINVDGTKASANVTYNNTLSGLTATDVQSAIDETVNKTKWKLHGIISTTTSALPADFEELMVISDSSNAGLCVTMNIPKIALSNTEKAYSLSSYYSASANYGVSIKATSTDIKVNWVSANGNDVTNISTVTVYYR